MSASIDRQALVAALRAVEGVLDADIDPDDAGGLGTLRLDLRPGVDEVAVAKVVSLVLREQFGLGVDADRVELVSPAESRPEPAAAPAETFDEPPVAPREVADTISIDLPEPRATRTPTRSAARPSIAKMHLLSSGLDVTASVTLASGTSTAVGEATGLASQTGVHRAVAQATLRAVEQLAGGGIRIELEHLEVASIGAEKTVLVLLTLLSGKGAETLTGAAAVRDDVRQAVIRATLDALNRRLELLLTEV